MSKYDDAEQRERYEVNRGLCRSISDELDAYVDGRMYRDENGSVRDIDDIPGDIPEDWEQLGVYDWADNVLDIEYLIGSDGGLKASKWCVCTGGPGIWCDTETHRVELYWWGDRASYEMSRRAIYELDAMAAEMYESARR